MGASQGISGLPNAPIRYFERPPTPRLRWAVETFWSLDGHLVGEAAAIPKPYVAFVVSLVDAHAWRAGNRSIKFCDGWITPLQTGPRFSRATGLTRLVAARLRPEAATQLFGPLPIGDGVPPLSAEAVIGADFRKLRDRLGEASTTAARFAIMETWLEARLLAGSQPLLAPVPSISWRANLLSDDLGLSERETRRRFEAAVGCSPKYWLRLHRLSAVLTHSAFQHRTETLASTAARFGLADQAHLAREFRLLAGMPPSAYQRRRDAEGLRDAPTMAPAR